MHLVTLSYRYIHNTVVWSRIHKPIHGNHKDGDQANKIAFYLFIGVCGLAARILVHINPNPFI